MTTLAATSFFPDLTRKIFWIKTNRVLAWSMIVSPPVQIATGVAFMTGLWIDLVILAVHGVLSLVLFGKPETKEKIFHFGMHVWGFRTKVISERHHFLLSGYRIVLATSAIGALFVTPGVLVLPIWLVFFYQLLRLPITVMQHIYLALIYAFRRWKMKGNDEAIATLILLVYLLLSLINIVRG